MALPAYARCTRAGARFLHAEALACTVQRAVLDT